MAKKQTYFAKKNVSKRDQLEKERPTGYISEKKGQLATFCKSFQSETTWKKKANWLHF